MHIFEGLFAKCTFLRVIHTSLCKMYIFEGNRHFSLQNVHFEGTLCKMYILNDETTHVLDIVQLNYLF